MTNTNFQILKIFTFQPLSVEFISKAVQNKGIRRHITENSQRNPFKKKQTI